MKAWHSLPTSGAKLEELSSVRQGPDELYQDFVSHLLQAVSRTVSDTEARNIRVKQLAYENINTLSGSIKTQFF